MRRFSFTLSLVRYVVGLAIALVAIGSLPTTRAAEIFVDNVGGDDLLDGTAPDKPGGYIGPVRTIAKAVRISGPSDRIQLKKNAEPYHESFTLFGGPNSGMNPDAPFIIQGNGAVLDGSRPVPAWAWRYYQGDVYRFAPPRLTYQQLFLDGRPAVRKPYEPASGKLPALEPHEWCLAGSCIYFRVDKGRLPSEYPLRYAAEQTGITLYRVHDVAILDLVVQGFQQDGINAHDGVRRAFLAGLNCRGNGRSGVAVTNTSQVDLGGCLLGDNGVAQLLLEGYAEVHLTNCDVLDNTAPKFFRHGGRLFIEGKAEGDGKAAE